MRQRVTGDEFAEQGEEAVAEVVDLDPEQTRQYLDAERKRFAALIDKTGYTA